MPSLAHLSVIARGSDTAWERARQASYRAGARKAEEQLARAQAAGDTTAELKALKAHTRQLEEDAKSWEDMAQSCMEERDKAQSEAAVAEALCQGRRSEPQNGDADGGSGLPCRVGRDSRSAGPT
jgi:predicted Zn-dependent protease